MNNIHRSLGFQNAVFEVDASAVFIGSSYLYASARDCGRIGQLMLNGGSLNGQRIMSEDWVRRATTPNTSDNEKAYGYQWWLNRGDENLRWQDLPEDAYSAQGNRQQYLMVIPSMDLGASEQVYDLSGLQPILLSRRTFAGPVKKVQRRERDWL